MPEYFEEVDLNRLIMGNSGGGTTSFYAACVDPESRCMPCSFCPYYVQ